MTPVEAAGSGHVALHDLAREIGMDRSHARKFALKCGFSFVRLRTADSRGQLVLALSRNDAEAVRELRREYGSGRVTEGAASSFDTGFFYVIQLVPDLKPTRLKLGFAVNVETRLGEHRTAAPTAVLVQAWPCRRTWEVAAIASITRDKCERVGGEVYDFGSVEEAIENASRFFGLMPQ